MKAERPVFHLGTTADGYNTYLYKEDVKTSIEITGLSQRGKSNLKYYLCKQMIEKNIPFFSLDPHGTVYERLLRFQCAVRYPRNILLFNPSYTKRVVGLNLWEFPYTDPAQILTKAQEMADNTLKVWGAENTYYYVNIQKWLRLLYYVLLEQKLTLPSLDIFLFWGEKDAQRKRQQIIDSVQYPPVKFELLELYSKGQSRFEDSIKTASTQLQFFKHPHVRRIIGLPQNNINFSRIRDESQIVLANFQPANNYLIGPEELRVIGTLLISHIWETVCRSKDRIDYYFIIDEFANYITKDIPHLLEESAKRGIHLILIHQQPDQVRSIVGAMQNAQTKIAFSLESNRKDVGWCTLRRFNHEVVEVKTPELPDYNISDEAVEAEIEERTKEFSSIEEVDRLLYRFNDEPMPLKEEDIEGYAVQRR